MFWSLNAAVLVEVYLEHEVGFNLFLDILFEIFVNALYL